MNTFCNQLRNISSFFILAIFLNSCTVWSGHKCDWDFITSVGGIRIDDPYPTKEGWFLPVQCDVSGLTKITNEPTTMNSALKCVRIEYSKKDSSVYITVFTSSIGYNNKTCVCEGVNIGQLRKGEYRVYYENNLHFIKTVTLK